MSHVFELYIDKDEITKEDFLQFYTVLSGYLGNLKKLRFHILLKDNHVRYFVQSDKDLSAISSSVTFCVLQPVDIDTVKLPSHIKNERFVNFVSGGSLLDLREKISVKRGKTLEHFVCDVQRLTSQRAHTIIKLYFKNAGDEWSLSKKITNKFPSHLFAFNFKTANNFMKRETPKYLSLEKVLHMIVPENVNALLEVSTFPYFARPYYLALPAYEFDKHSMIVGASGSGKSKFIELLIDRLERLPSKQQYRVVVLDPHANLAQELGKIQHSKVVDFSGESTELFADAGTDITAATELTTTLMKSLMNESYNARVERVLRFSLFVLFTSKMMSLGNLKRLLLELEFRQQLLDSLGQKVPHNITQFFSTDYNEIRTKYYDEGLLPILTIIDELALQPTLMAEGGLSLKQTIENNFLTVFSLNKVSMGEKVVKTVAGLLIQQIFLLAQARTFNQRVLLIIDEVSVVQNPAIASILSEARKFNLFVILTQQYFSQVDKSLQDSIFANVYNYYCFRVAEEDAEQLVGNLPMEIPKDMLIESKEKGVDEKVLKVRMLTDLHPRECIVRVSSNGLLLPCFKARTLDMTRNTIVTTMSENYIPLEYKETPADIEEFLKKAELVPVGTRVELTAEQKTSSYSEEPVTIDSHLPPPAPPPDSQPIKSPETTRQELQKEETKKPTMTLDEIMQEDSSKGNKE